MSGAHDGGTAFPVLELNKVTGDVCAQHLGMTLRDYFAANINSPDGISMAWGELMVGPYPRDSNGHLLPLSRESALWWADVEATYRGVMADAMLREPTSSTCGNPMNTSRATSRVLH